MKYSKEEKRARLIAKANHVVDEYLDWEEKNRRPDLMQIEDITLKLRKELGKELAQMAVEEQESQRPVVDPLNWTLLKGLKGSTFHRHIRQRKPIGSFELSRCQVPQ